MGQTLLRYLTLTQWQTRELKCWDTAGLLVPAHVDQFSSYRSCDPARLERLRLIEKEHAMSQIEIISKPLPAVRLAARTAVVADQTEVAGVVGPLFDTVREALTSAGASLDQPIAQYESGDDGLHIVAGYAITADAPDGVEVVDLPPVPAAICGVHLGAMDRIQESWQAVHTEMKVRGFAPSGPCREVYVRAVSDNQSDWVTELQQPVLEA